MLSQLAYILAGFWSPGVRGGAAGFRGYWDRSVAIILSFPLAAAWWDTLSTGGTRSYRWPLDGCGLVVVFNWCALHLASSTRTASARPSRRLVDIQAGGPPEASLQASMIYFELGETVEEASPTRRSTEKGDPVVPPGTGGAVSLLRELMKRSSQRDRVRRWP